jgi:hypothetical protein
VEGFLEFVENSVYGHKLIIYALSEINMAENWNRRAIVVKVSHIEFQQN